MDDALHQRVRQRLAEADCFPDGGPVDVVETHISVVFLSREFAWKLLKPVKFDFLDFSTPDARREECRNEVRLNRRLAPDVYRDVVPVTESPAGELSLDGAGTAVDWVVKMQRLPDEATLQAKVAAGTATAHDLDRLLDVLQPFFENAERGPEIAADGSPEVIRQNLVENLETLDSIAETSVLRSVQLQYLATHADLFRQRMADGWVRDGHGDLRAEHVYFTNPPAIVDCIAFNERFRHADTLDEICFLATDLQRLGRDDLAAELIARYRRRLEDPAPEGLSRFFQSYRFAVRAKVACLRGAEERDDRRDSHHAAARDLQQRALDMLQPEHVPCLVVFCGISGSGKSTIARQLAADIGAVHLASDVIRKELHGVRLEDHTAERDLYSKQASERTYAALRERGRAWLSQGCTVLLDATFQRRADRDTARRVAGELGTPFLLIDCRADAETAAERIRARRASGGDASDADLAVLRQQLAKFEDPDEVASSERITISAGESPEQARRLIVSRLPVV